MTAVDTGRERLDLKRLWKQAVYKLWIVIAAAIAGAIIGVMVYTIYGSVAGPALVYEIRNDYYIYFNTEEFPNGVDYYNAYTWDSILRDDPIVLDALELMPGVSKEDVLNTVSGEILGDYRILTVICKGEDSELVTTISDSYKQTVPKFADKIDMLEKIELWTDSDMTSYNPYTRKINAGILGGLIGAIISLFALLISIALDDGIYTERDWLQRYPKIPFLGKKGSDEYQVNLEHILGNEEEYKILAVDEFRFSAEVFEELRTSPGVILKIRQGSDKADILDKIVFTLSKQDISIVAMMFAAE